MNNTQATKAKTMLLDGASKIHTPPPQQDWISLDDPWPRASKYWLQTSTNSETRINTTEKNLYKLHAKTPDQQQWKEKRKHIVPASTVLCDQHRRQHQYIYIKKEKTKNKVTNTKIEKEVKNNTTTCEPTPVPDIRAHHISAPDLTKLTAPQSKYNIMSHSRMHPDPSIWNHPAFTCLWQYATKGCPVDCGPTWSRDHLAAMAQWGPHKLATSPEAIWCLCKETMEKVEQGLACLVFWDDIKDAPHPNRKISPIAAVPHKSRLYHLILDLSFQLCVNGLTMPSVNKTTTPLSNHKSMEQMGQVYWRIISTVAYINQKNGHLVFAKWDIKDGFWYLVVSDEDTCHFGFVLPWLNKHDPIELVVSNWLSMGWCESPPLFCTTGETARDATQDLCDNHILGQPTLPYQHQALGKQKNFWNF